MGVCQAGVRVKVRMVIYRGLRGILPIFLSFHHVDGRRGTVNYLCNYVKLFELLRVVAF